MATLKELREAAEQAANAVQEEERRQREAYNAELVRLRALVRKRLGHGGPGGRWVVGEASRDHVRIVSARPGWAAQEALRVEFFHAEGDALHVFESKLAASVKVVDAATGDAVRFNHAPHERLLLAVVDTVAELMSPPDQ